MNHDEAMNSQVDRIFSKNLFSLFDQKWRDMRVTLTPIFTSSKMKTMFGLLSDHAQDFVKFFEETAERKGKVILDTKNIFGRFTADGISTSVLGFEGDCLRNEQSYAYRITQKMLDEVFSTSANFKLIFASVMPKLYHLTGLQLLSEEVIDFFRRVVVDVIKEREQKGISRPDVIQLLLQVKKGQLQENDRDVNDKELANFSANIEYDVGSKQNNITKFDDEDLIAQGFVFFGAGFETTSSLLLLTSYELAWNPEIQKTLIEEIDQSLKESKGKPVTYEALHKLKFLDMIISESLRKWPPAPQTDRSCTKDYDLKVSEGRTLKIKKGDLIYLPIYGIQHDPNYFENPEKFDPSRFSDENKVKINPGTYLPFGIGPRVCIGSRFALMEAKLLLFNVLSKFTIEVCDETPKKLTMKTTFQFGIVEKIILEFKPRK